MACEDCGETAASLYEKDVKLFILLGFAASLHYAAVFGNNCYFLLSFSIGREHFIQMDVVIIDGSFFCYIAAAGVREDEIMRLHKTF